MYGKVWSYGQSWGFRNPPNPLVTPPMVVVTVVTIAALFIRLLTFLSKSKYLLFVNDHTFSHHTLMYYSHVE